MKEKNNHKIAAPLYKQRGSNYQKKEAASSPKSTVLILIQFISYDRNSYDEKKESILYKVDKHLHTQIAVCIVDEKDVQRIVG